MKSFFITLGFSFLLGHTYAQGTLTLDKIKEIIAENNPSFHMLDANARSMDEAAKGAYSWEAPLLGAGVFMVPYNPKLLRYRNGINGMGAVMLSAQQMFPNRKAQDAEFAYRNALSSVELQKKDVVMNDLLYRARENYYEWIVQEKKLKVLNEDEELLRFMMQSAEIRYKNGFGKISAYYKVQAALDNIENMRLMVETEIVQKRIEINTVMNRNTNDTFAIDTDIVWIDFETNKPDSTYLMNQRSDIKVIDKSVEVNRLQIQSEMSKLKPQFGIRYDNMFGWARQPWQYSIMGMVRIPLTKWSSKMNRANAESLFWQNEALRNQKQVIINEAEGEVMAALTGLELKKKQMKLYEQKIIPALRLNFQTTQLGYEQNTEELFQLFDAWETLNMTQLDYLDQLQSALDMQAMLMKLTEVK